MPTIFPWTKTKRRKAPKRRYMTSETETASEMEQFEDINDKIFKWNCQSHVHTSFPDQTVPLGEVW